MFENLKRHGSPVDTDKIDAIVEGYAMRRDHADIERTLDDRPLAEAIELAIGAACAALRPTLDTPGETAADVDAARQIVWLLIDRIYNEAGIAALNTEKEQREIDAAERRNATRRTALELLVHMHQPLPAGAEQPDLTALHAQYVAMLDPDLADDRTTAPSDAPPTVVPGHSDLSDVRLVAAELLDEFERFLTVGDHPAYESTDQEMTWFQNHPLHGGDGDDSGVMWSTVDDRYRHAVRAWLHAKATA